MVKISHRMCLGCRGRTEKRELIRLVCEGQTLKVDSPHTVRTRGAYVHARIECWLRLAGNEKSLGKALRLESSGWLKGAITELSKEITRRLTSLRKEE